MLHCSVVHCTVLHCAVLHCTLCCSIMFCYKSLHCTVLDYTVLHYSMLSCPVMYCTYKYTVFATFNSHQRLTRTFAPHNKHYHSLHHTVYSAARFMSIVSRMPGHALPIVGDKGRTLEYPLPLLSSDPGLEPGTLNSTDPDRSEFVQAGSEGKYCT